MVETGFPVVVKNDLVPIKIDFAGTPLSRLEIFEQDGTAVSGPIGSGSYTGLANVINTNIILGSAAELGGFNLYVKTFSINSTKDADFIIRINQAAGFLGTVAVTADREFIVKVKAGVTYILSINALIAWGANIYLYVEKFGDTTGNANVKFQHDSIKIFQSTNPFSRHSIFGIGDSIMKGNGSTYLKSHPYLAHFALLYKYYRDFGFDIKGINKGVPGAIIEDIVNLVRWGYYDVSSPVSVIYFSIGTNVSPSNTSFTNSLQEILDYFQKRYPNAQKLICAPISRLDIKELTVAQYRPIMAAEVTARADPKMHYIDLSLSFDASNPVYGIIMGDYNTGVGGEVHPNDAGHAALFNYVKTFCIANNIYPE
ncbi:MAG: SGNH/GDSL hydrolase family protein [Bacteroidota bacterium]